MRRTIDFFVRPQVAKFVHRTALQLDHAELVFGARAAALAVNDAVGSAIRGDSAPLDELSAGALDATLYAAICDEVRRGQQWTAAPDVDDVPWSSSSELVDMQLDELSRQRRAIEGDAIVSNVLLVVGAQRRDYVPGLHQLQIGSSLVVLGSEPTGLWRQDVQRELMSRHGCSVHCSVAFTDQLYTFEAAVEGEALLNGSRGEDDEGVEPSFMLADLNGMAPGHGRFWRTATEVSLWPEGWG